MSRRDNEPTVRLEGWIFQLARGKAICVRPAGGERSDDIWLPYSHIIGSDPDITDREPERNERIDLEITGWIAEQKGLDGEPGGLLPAPNLSVDRGQVSRKEETFRQGVMKVLSPLAEELAALLVRVRTLEVAQRTDTAATATISSLVRSNAALIVSLETLMPLVRDLNPGIRTAFRDGLHEAKRAMSTHPADQPWEPEVTKEGSDDDIPF